MTANTGRVTRRTAADLSRRPTPIALAGTAGCPILDIVIPVYNEQAVLDSTVRRLHRFLADRLPFPARITIADNASTISGNTGRKSG